MGYFIKKKSSLIFPSVFSILCQAILPVFYFGCILLNSKIYTGFFFIYSTYLQRVNIFFSIVSYMFIWFFETFYDGYSKIVVSKSNTMSSRCWCVLSSFLLKFWETSGCIEIFCFSFLLRLYLLVGEEGSQLFTAGQVVDVHIPHWASIDTVVYVCLFIIAGLLEGRGGGQRSTILSIAQ